MDQIINDSFILANTYLEDSSLHNFELVWANSIDSSSSDSVQALLLLDDNVVGSTIISVYFNALMYINGMPYDGNVIFIDYTHIDPIFQGYGLSRALLLLPYILARYYHAYIASMDVGANEQGLNINRYTVLNFNNVYGDLYDSDTDVGDSIDFNNILLPENLESSYGLLIDRLQ
jgi:hypothetical protein